MQDQGLSQQEKAICEEIIEVVGPIFELGQPSYSHKGGSGASIAFAVASAPAAARAAGDGSPQAQAEAELNVPSLLVEREPVGIVCVPDVVKQHHVGALREIGLLEQRCGER